RVEVLGTSALTGDGIDRLRLCPGQTGALVGSSGVGKSTLVNALLGGARQATAAVRAWDDHGRHITTNRELFALPGGGLLIDTPGMRELGLWDESGMDATFADVEELAADCRFRDCRHAGEPGCAGADQLAPERLAGWHKLQRELAYHARRERKRYR